MPRRGRGLENESVTGPIVKWLNDLPACRALKVHGGLYQTRDVDIIGCYRGQFFAIECKRAEGMEPTRRQQRALDLWQAAGGIVGVCTSLDEAKAFIGDIDAGGVRARLDGDRSGPGGGRVASQAQTRSNTDG